MSDPMSGAVDPRARASEEARERSDEVEPVLGIDLGTTFSAMALVNDFGKPEILTNGEGFPTTPSVVHFYDEDACVVGDEAVKMVVVDPGNVVRFIKRHMGEEDFAMEFYGRTYTPQEISALILRKLKDDAEERLGRPVNDAVVTVPAYFNSAQRGATAEAGTIAGLNVLSIINEPTAAAIAYGLDRIGGERKLLVLDLGGGTFDVTVMDISGTKLTTIASDGNAELGGKDWDDRLLNYVADAFVKEYHLDPRDDPAPYQELYERCLNAKISLSTKERAIIPVNYRGKRLAVKVERAQFEALTSDLVQQTADTATLVLEKAGLTWPSIDDILLVGGSTRMPMVRQVMFDLAGKLPVDGVNPDECVALGASLAGVFRHRPHHPALREKREQIVRRAREKRAREAEIKPKESRGAMVGTASGGHAAIEIGEGSESTDDPPSMPSVIIEDATTHPLGIIVLDKNRKERVVELIPEGTRLPYEHRWRFGYAYDNMTAVRVEVTEGVGVQRDEVAVIGRVDLTGLPPRPRGTPIEVIYQYSIDQILGVRVVDVESGLSRTVEIRFQGGLTKEQVDAARGRNQGMSVD
ncbi:MAG: Hsp70 family protein [Deltaproteobacteria bacterium]|nr:Hsp70 family protein [Deltaproteobacteria bacterium]